MTARRVVSIAALLVVGGAAVATARVSLRPQGIQGAQDAELRRPGPDSGRVAKLLDAIAATDPLVCTMIADQIGNFWNDNNDNQPGTFADAPKALGAARDSLHGHVRDARAVALLVSHLRDDNACVRRTAAKLLGRSTVATSRLLTLLGDAAVRVQEAAAYAIAEGDRYEARSALESRVGGSIEPVAAMSAWALVQLHDSVASSVFTRALGSGFVRVRIAAAQGLGEKQDEATRAAVERALADADAGVRRAAAHALGEIGVAQSAPSLAGVLADGNAQVRYAAAGALGELHDLRIAPAALVRAAAATDAQLAEIAIHSLAEIRDPATIDVMIGALTHANRDVRLRAVHALGEMGSPKAVPGLLGALKDGDAEVRRAAAEALGELREG